MRLSLFLSSGTHLRDEPFLTGKAVLQLVLKRKDIGVNIFRQGEVKNQKAKKP